MRQNYKYTIYACYVGYMVQAIVNNLAPLLFLTFQKQYHISINLIGLLVSINFAVQLLVDFLAMKYVDRIGYRAAMIAAHVFSAVGLAGMAVFPGVFPHPYAGLVLAISMYAVGGGLLEVLVSPIVEACPTTDKAGAMSLLHSFYCWGHVAVVLLSTLFFYTVGIEHWKWLTLLWAFVPLANIILFAQVPILALVKENQALSVKSLCSTKVFWILFLMMVCSGAAEQSMSQWASAFAELGLNVNKTIGDLLGPCMFAVLMGCSRALYGICSDKIPLKTCMIGSSVLCVGSYLLAVFSPIPLLSLVGCALTGLSVGIMWPGTFSMATNQCPQGGTAMFALLALAGDLGCGGGPGVVGWVSGMFDNQLKMGLLAAIVFPILLIWGVLRLKNK